MPADPATAAGLLTGGLTTILNLLSVAGGLGTAAMGLVDATKAFDGGASNFGFGEIRAGISPFLLASAVPGPHETLQTLRANWLNGVAKADQKAKARALVHVGLNPANAIVLAKAVGVDAVAMQSLANNIAGGIPPSQAEINVLGQFDVVLGTVLDSAYERADQRYRNACKNLSMLFATVLGSGPIKC